MPLIAYYLDVQAKLYRSVGGPDLTPPDPFGETGYGQSAYGNDSYGSTE